MAQNTSLNSHQWDMSIDADISALFLHLQWAQMRSIEGMRPLLAKYQLSAAEFDVLATLRNAEVPHIMTPSEIQNEVVITSGGLTKIMLQLENRGFITRQQLENDLRVKPLMLTEVGKKIIEQAMEEMIKATSMWMRKGLSPTQIKELTSLLKILVQTPLSDN